MKRTPFQRLTWLALLMVLAVVVAQTTMLHELHDPFPVTPHSKPYPRSAAGPGATLVLDGVCCLPALLILLSRAMNPKQAAARSWACRIGGCLCIWAVASVFWSDDKFAAVIGVADLIAAFVLLWTAAQLITSWARFRLVTAICHGLLLVYVTQCALYKFVDLPDNAANFDKKEFLAERGWKEGDFAAIQFEKKLLNEVLGFNYSSNSLAAMLVLLIGISGGICIQRLADRSPSEAAAVGIAIPIAVGFLIYTQCKAAFFTPLLMIGILLLVWRARWFLTFRNVTALVITAMAAVLVYGLVRHSLPSASLNFRWRYWTAAWKLFVAHPMGVGWDNFGIHYLRYRLPAAAEEIQDPHNFLIRFLTELGIVGFVLAVAWLGRLWWEMTQPAFAARSSPAQSSSPILIISLVGLLAMGMNVASSVDFNEPRAFVSLEVIRRALFLCALVVGASLAGIRSLKDVSLSDKPAPWVVYAVLAALAAFLVHNLIEFSFFESGPLLLFALLAGSVLGLRQSVRFESSRFAPAVLLASSAAWLAATIGLCFPMIAAESLADQGDSAMRAGRLDEAADEYFQAFQKYVPFNADYVYRSALAMAYDPTVSRALVRNRLDVAIAENPAVSIYYMSRARLDSEMNDPGGVQKDFNQAIGLNPNEVSIHMEYGEVLMRLGLTDLAAGQFEQALKYNNLLDAAEPKRIDNAIIQARLDAAKKAGRP